MSIAKKSATLIDPATLDPHGLVPRRDVEALMVARLKKPGESDFKARARISDNLDHAVDTAKKRRLPSPEPQGWRVDVIGEYLRKVHRGKFEDWPVLCRVVGEFHGEWLTGVPDDAPLSDDLSTCHEEIQHLRRTVFRLETKVSELRNELNQQLEARAERRRKHSEAGKKARGVPKRGGN